MTHRPGEHWFHFDKECSFIFTNVWLSWMHFYLSLGEGVALHLNIFEFPLLKKALCHVWWQQCEMLTITSTTTEWLHWSSYVSSLQDSETLAAGGQNQCMMLTWKQGDWNSNSPVNYILYQHFLQTNTSSLSKLCYSISIETTAYFLSIIKIILYLWHTY